MTIFLNAVSWFSRYGAKLAEPAGITVNGEVASWFQEDYWIGNMFIIVKHKLNQSVRTCTLIENGIKQMKRRALKYYKQHFCSKPSEDMSPKMRLLNYMYHSSNP